MGNCLSKFFGCFTLIFDWFRKRGNEPRAATPAPPPTPTTEVDAISDTTTMSMASGETQYPSSPNMSDSVAVIEMMNSFNTLESSLHSDPIEIPIDPLRAEGLRMEDYIIPTGMVEGSARNVNAMNVTSFM